MMHAGVRGWVGDEARLGFAGAGFTADKWGLNDKVSSLNGKQVLGIIWP